MLCGWSIFPWTRCVSKFSIDTIVCVVVAFSGSTSKQKVVLGRRKTWCVYVGGEHNFIVRFVAIMSIDSWMSSLCKSTLDICFVVLP